MDRPDLVRATAFSAKGQDILMSVVQHRGGTVCGLFRGVKPTRVGEWTRHIQANPTGLSTPVSARALLRMASVKAGGGGEVTACAITATHVVAMACPGLPVRLVRLGADGTSVRRGAKGTREWERGDGREILAMATESFWVRGMMARLAAEVGGGEPLKTVAESAVEKRRKKTTCALLLADLAAPCPRPSLGQRLDSLAPALRRLAVRERAVDPRPAHELANRLARLKPALLGLRG